MKSQNINILHQELQMRKENKYLVSIKVANEIKDSISSLGIRDSNCKDKNYYIKTEYIAIWKNLNYKGKFRIRFYCNCIFFESKYKINSNQYKERVQIETNTYFELKSITNEKKLLNYISRNFSQINISFIDNLELCNLSISYERDAWNINYNQNNYRITFDYNLISNNTFVFSSEFCIIEIKGLNNKLLENKLGISQYKIKFSKYKTAKKIKGTCVQ